MTRSLVTLSCRPHLTRTTLAGFILLTCFACAGCASEGDTAASTTTVVRIKSTLEGLVRYDPTVAPPGSLTPVAAHTLATQAVHDAGRGLVLFNDPTFVIDGAYFFSTKDKFKLLLRGVLVDSNSGAVSIVDTELYADP
jgi:hypothetical protein